MNTLRVLEFNVGDDFEVYLKDTYTQRDKDQYTEPKAVILYYLC